MKRFMVWAIAFVFLFTTSAIAAEVKKEAAAPAVTADPAKAEKKEVKAADTKPAADKKAVADKKAADKKAGADKKASDKKADADKKTDDKKAEMPAAPAKK
ncbi:MAG: hypothetical protein Q8K00_13265 [Syntrophales bacterium]|nr:hypothetical protein [Syntrophales bacterium]